MAFVCLPQSDGYSKPCSSDNGATAIQADVGYDDVSGKLYTLFVMLDQAAGAIWELSFCLTEYDGETEATYDFYSGQHTSFIEQPDRKAVLERLLWVVGELVTLVEPDRFCMCSFDYPLPEKAVLKYERICDCVRLCGYDVREEEPNHGQRIWWMERRTPPTVAT